MSNLKNKINLHERSDTLKFATTISTNKLKVLPIKVKDKKLKKIIEEISNRAVIYIRVSSEEQVLGFSLDGQEETCRSFAERNGYEVVKVFREEGQSAKTTKRDEFQKMMKFCRERKNRIKYIIVYRIDRFTRNMCDLLTEEKALEKLGIEILTATETNEKGYMGKFARHMNGLIAQLDNERRADATVNGMKNGFLKGNWMWKAPYGYYNDKNHKTIVQKPKESKVVIQVFEKMKTGCYSQADILTELKKEGIILKPAHLCEMLRNPIYCGYIYKPEWNPEPIKGKFEAIISEKTFNTVQEILDGRKPAIAPHDFENEDYPLKQFLYCPHCGKPLTGSNSKSQRGKKLYQYYACYNKECPSKNKEVCKSKFSISKDVAEKTFTDILKTITPKDEVLDLFKDIARDVFDEQTIESKTMQTKMQQELDKIEALKDTILDLLIANDIVKEEYDRRFKKLIAQENEIKANMQINIITSQEFNKFLENTLDIIQNLSKAWNNSILRIKKNIQNLIFPNGLSADFSTFQNSLNPIIFKQIGSIKEPCFGKLPPSEFESLSTP